jgi:hypothetical protein
MIDSLPNSNNSFESIDLKNVLILISVLVDIDLKMKSVIRQRFNQQATNFDETVSFLQTLGSIETSEDEIRLTDDFEKLIKNSDNETLRNHILDLVLKINNPYQAEMLKYLSKFQHTSGSIDYKPTDIKRSEFSDARNFLIELEVVKYDYESDKYIVLPEHIHLFALAIEKSSTYSPAKLKRKLIQKDEIGKAAELAIMKYEKNRVGKKYQKLVEHISEKNAAAGYDIKSVTVDGDNTERRYIEVKAVPADSYKFYWSQNELRVAELLNTNYYLYLLPVLSKMDFAIDKLKIISNPIPEIFENPDAWNVESDVVCCSLNT